MPGWGSDRGSQMEYCWHQRGNFPVQELQQRGSSADYIFSQEVPKWVSEPVHLHTGPSGATAVLLGAHQHFTVQLLLLFFKGIFYLSSLQSSIPTKEFEMSDNYWWCWKLCSLSMFYCWLGSTKAMKCKPNTLHYCLAIYDAATDFIYAEKNVYQPKTAVCWMATHMLKHPLSLVSHKVWIKQQPLGLRN